MRTSKNLTFTDVFSRPRQFYGVLSPFPARFSLPPVPPLHLFTIVFYLRRDPMLVPASEG